MADRVKLLRSIASTIADYRQGEIAKPDAEHVDKWIMQFDESVQTQMLAELDHVLQKTYFKRASVVQFLSSVVSSTDLAGDDPRDFWRKANFLCIQKAGNSQREMLDIFDTILHSTYGLRLGDCGSDDGPYIYLDDAIFSGNRLRQDLSSWIQSPASVNARLHVIFINLHRGGKWYAKKELKKVAHNSGMKLAIKWWCCNVIEDRKFCQTNSDVLRPSTLPHDPAVQKYVEGLEYSPVLRTGSEVGNKGYFSSNAGRVLLEQQFLIAGVHIREKCPYLNEYQRPLGNMVLQTLGFGALVITFRNCPNNCPLALWVDSPWHPLFPRKTN